MHEPNRRTLAAGSGSFSYLEWTPGQPPRGAVLLLHGGGFDSARLSWDGLGAALAQAGWRVIAPDIPGYGDSPAPSWPCTQDALVRHVGDLVQALGLEQFVLGGLSMGGGMSLGYALGHQERIRGLMLLGSYGISDRTNGGPLSLPIHLLSWAMLKTRVLPRLTCRYTRTADRKSVDKGISGIVRNPAFRTPELVDLVLEEMGRHAEGQDVFREWQDEQVLLTRLKTNYVPLLSTFTKPTLLIHGERDIGVPVAAAALAKDALPNARLVIAPDAGHWVQRDAPELSLDAMRTFLGKVAP